MDKVTYRVDLGFGRHESAPSLPAARERAKGAAIGYREIYVLAMVGEDVIGAEKWSRGYGRRDHPAYPPIPEDPASPTSAPAAPAPKAIDFTAHGLRVVHDALNMALQEADAFDEEDFRILLLERERIAALQLGDDAARSVDWRPKSWE